MLDSLKQDIAILSASGPEWHARLRRLAARVPSLDIFGSGYVLRDSEGWEITTTGREFLRALEAVTQDNRPAVAEQPSPEAPERRQGELIVVGHRFKNRKRRRDEPVIERSDRRLPRSDSV